MAATTKIWVNSSPPAVEDVDLNGFKTENNNLIIGSGQGLSIVDNQQTHKAVAHYAAVGDFYGDSGTANTYVLSVSGSQVAPPTYANGMRIRFVAGNSNTGPSTVNVAGLGVKNFVDDLTGAALDGNVILAGSKTSAYYDGTDFRVTGVVGQAFLDPTHFAHFYDDCINTNRFVYFGGGAGAVATGINALADEYGLIIFTGPGTGLAGSLLVGDTRFNNRGTGVVTVSTQIALTALSDATDDFAYKIGLFDRVVNPPITSTNLMVFLHSRVVNGGNWTIRGNDGAGGVSDTDTGITPVANTIYKFKVVYDPSVPRAEYFIDGVSVHIETLATNMIDVNSDDISFKYALDDTSTATTRPLDIRSLEFTQTFPSGR